MDDIDPELAELVGMSAMALAAVLADMPETAEFHLRSIPRAKRGDLKAALDDLDMMLSRLGNGANASG